MQNYELMISVENSYQGLALKKVKLHVTSMIPSFVSAIKQCDDLRNICNRIQYMLFAIKLNGNIPIANSNVELHLRCKKTC